MLFYQGQAVRGPTSWQSGRKFLCLTSQAPVEEIFNYSVNDFYSNCRVGDINHGTDSLLAAAAQSGPSCSFSPGLSTPAFPTARLISYSFTVLYGASCIKINRSRSIEWNTKGHVLFLQERYPWDNSNHTNEQHFRA